MTHLPLGLLQPRCQLSALPLEGGTATLQQFVLLQQLGQVLLQLLLLLLQLQHLELQDLLPPMCCVGRLPRLGRTALPQPLQLLLTPTLLLLKHLGQGMHRCWEDSTAPSHFTCHLQDQHHREGAAHLPKI